MKFRNLILLPLLSLVLTACGGGMGSTSVPNAPSIPAPVVRQSVGGIWLNPAGPNVTALEVVTIYVSETGELILSDSTPGFGTGALAVNGTNEVSGSYFYNPLPVFSAFPGPLDQNCTVTGTVDERTSMTLDIRCVDSDGGIDESTKTFGYFPAYLNDSSLTTIAGNYTLESNAAENTFSVNDDGTIFGMLVNGSISCVVNGTAQIIDPDYALFGIELEFANCTGPSTIFEGASLNGFGLHNLSDNRPDSIYLIISGDVAGDFRWMSLLYDPV